MKDHKLRLCGLSVLAGASLFSAMPSHAATLPLAFSCITNNSAANCAAGATQLSVDVTDLGVGANQVKFIFNNLGSAASSITDVYFDDGTLLGIASLLDSGSGVAFSTLASPGNLPGGNNADPDFETTAGFSADSDPAVQPNGVNANANEWLAVIFNLQSGGTYADVVNELATGELRVGMHVQGFSGGGSESFVNMAAVPLPGAVLLLGSALAGLGLFRRRSGNAAM